MLLVKRKLFLLALLEVTLSGLHTAKGDAVDLSARIGSAIHFHLPDVSKCGGYSLTDPTNNHVVMVYNMSHTPIGSKYADRSTSMLLSNGTLLFTLHRVQYSDEGTYLVKPGGQSPDLCWRKFELTVLRDRPSTGYWLSWGDWSSCDKTCGAATRVRLRECSIPTFCYDGDNRETKACEDNKQCETQIYEWSGWSHWSDCSLTCGGGRHDRQRYCLLNKVERASTEHCSGDYYENKECSMTPCINVRQPTLDQWTTWGPWTACSLSCGSGFKTRERRCRDTVKEVDARRCMGSSTENTTCSIPACEKNVGTSTEDGKLKANDHTVQLPLSGIVGTGAGVFILILAIVICVLVTKLKRKKEMLGIVKTGSVKRSNSSKDAYRGKKESVISFSSQGVSGVHVYDEIDDVKSQRMSVLTIDNPYVTMPKSASPTGTATTKNGTVTYSNIQENVFVFDSSTEVGQGENRKVSNAYQNTSDPYSSNMLTVPRHMSVDSTGYLMPGNAMERAARRNKRYLKKT
ncbi:semaphorin-5A-like [Mercenaria mercenaria]|uniref:semaphorin-5A-like n=1 Tax=Mercenaria mercenaria TaxID=6596 RepID=UPI00234EC67C|nr:semaphorin-5A-like [Mercenaria mercenaria]